MILYEYHAYTCHSEQRSETTAVEESQKTKPYFLDPLSSHRMTQALPVFDIVMINVEQVAERYAVETSHKTRGSG